MNDTRTPRSTCAACGYCFDAATNTTGTGGPKPGDLSVCLKCGHLAVFEADLTVRELTLEEEAALPADLLIEVGRIERARQEVLR